MSLSDLPMEILLNIAELLDDAGINALSHTNSQLYGLLNKFLYSRDMKSRNRSLLWAVEKGVEATVRLALAASRNLDLGIPESYHIALQAAAFRGHMSLVQLLLEVEGINPNFAGGLEECAPLILAAEMNNSAIVELLLAAPNIDPNIRERHSNTTPLWNACWNGNASIVKQLLARKDVDLNICSVLGETMTPLATACFFGYEEVTNLLLAANHSIDVNHHTARSNPPLIIAVDGGYVSVVESLLARDDLDPNIVGHTGVHALGHAVCLGHTAIVKLLLGRPDTDPNLVMEGGRSALMLAATSKSEIVKLLLDRGDIDVNNQDDLGRTALGEATRSRCLGNVKLLLCNLVINSPRTRARLLVSVAVILLPLLFSRPQY
jgi:ankyrin repeat protein